MDVNNLTGRLLGQYELIALLKRGGMGAVYRAIQISLGREVAIKVLPPALASEPGYLERFNREARTAASLEHPHIVPIHDYGVDGEISFVAMRLLTGGSLMDRFEPNARLAPQAVIALLNPLADALDYAHSRGVIHRDIKPSNIMFDERGTVYLVDFGIAKLVQSTTALTQESMFVGTPAYMAPEQWKGDPVSQATDQYALAVMTYQLLAGQPPFEGQTPYVMMHRHLNEPPPPLQSRRADLPGQLDAVLGRALAKEPADRYPSTGAFAAAFALAASIPSSAVTQVGATALPDEQTMVAQSTPQPGGQLLQVIPSVPRENYQPEGPSPVPPPARPRWRRLALGCGVLLAAGCCLLTVAAALDDQTDDGEAVTQEAAPELSQLVATSAGMMLTARPSPGATGAAATGLPETQTEPPVAATSDADQDGDGLTDLMESQQYGTDPAQPDTDRDGLTDGTEVSQTGTDPLASDTDGDGSPDSDDPAPLDNSIYGQGRLWYEQAVNALSAGDYAGAVALLSQTLDRASQLGVQSPVLAEILSQRARAYLGLGDNQAAFDDLSAAIGYAPDTSMLYTLRAEAASGLEDWSQAIADATRAIDLGDMSSDVYALRAHAFQQSGQIESAVSSISEAISLEPDRAEYWALSGRLQFESGRYVASAGDFQAALDRGADAFDMYTAMGESYAAAAGRAHPLAIAAFQAAANLAPNDPYPLRRLGDLHFEQPDAQALAAGMYRRYVEASQRAGAEPESYVLERLDALAAEGF